MNVNRQNRKIFHRVFPPLDYLISLGISSNYPVTTVSIVTTVTMVTMVTTVIMVTKVTMVATVTKVVPD